ncbi:hypothetical protein FRC17_010661 [Serendipita sp. 399]|nr:hypothetical protein FRC17_010661 [Serendipita sp. 399]
MKFRKARVAATSEDERFWEVKLGNAIRDFSMDIFQDLIVTVVYQSPSMSNGKDHPLAQQPLVKIKVAEPTLSSCNISINNDVVGILFEQKIVRLESTAYLAMDSLCFLSSNRILVGWRPQWDSEVQDTHTQASLDVYDLSRGIDLQPRPEKQFLLPELTEGTRITNFIFSGDPAPAPSKLCPRLFYTSPDYRICKILIYCQSNVNGVVSVEQPISLVTFINTLLHDYGSFDSTSEESGPVTIVPWEQWEEHTRITRWNPPSSVYGICVSGTRVVRKVPTDIGDQFKVQICDFNPYAVNNIRNNELLSKNYTSDYRYIHSSFDTLGERRVFKQKVNCGLPYLEITTKRSFQLHDVMLDHDSIYLIRGQEMEILSF